jgi:hypothetical protein
LIKNFRIAKKLEEKKDCIELLTETEEKDGKIKKSILIEPNLYRDLTQDMKDVKGTLDIEDQYGELMKGKPVENEADFAQQYMQLLEDYEKLQVSKQKGKKEDSEENKADKRDKKEKRDKPSEVKEAEGKKVKTITCSSCKEAVYTNPKDYKAHVKSGWHCANLKRKMDVNKKYIYLIGTAPYEHDRI